MYKVGVATIEGDLGSLVQQNFHTFKPDGEYFTRTSVHSNQGYRQTLAYVEAQVFGFNLLAFVTGPDKTIVAELYSEISNKITLNEPPPEIKRFIGALFY